MKSRQLDFTNQDFFIGIDVHANNWKVQIRSNRTALKTFTLDPKPDQLSNYMNKNYPSGNYFSVYEAGFSGFKAHREFLSLGIENIVINPGDVPSTYKEKLNKSDIVDCRKLARELENGSLRAIHVPTEIIQELRCLCQLRVSIVKDITRTKNRIKSLLYYKGEQIPRNDEIAHWSKEFIHHISQYENKHKTLLYFIEQFKRKRIELARLLKEIKEYLFKNKLMSDIKLLMSVPGIGFVTAITFLSKVVDVKLFNSFDRLAAFVGLIPMIQSSDQTMKNYGMHVRACRQLRSYLIEAAWIGIRKDPALFESYCKYCIRMAKNKAIVRIAKKLLSRIFYVLKNKKSYVLAVVE